jgi:hypothetical protein
VGIRRRGRSERRGRKGERKDSKKCTHYRHRKAKAFSKHFVKVSSKAWKKIQKQKVNYTELDMTYNSLFIKKMIVTIKKKKSWNRWNIPPIYQTIRTYARQTLLKFYNSTLKKKKK